MVGKIHTMRRRSLLRDYSGIGDKLFMTFIYMLLSLAAASILLPVMNVIASSFSSPKAISIGRVTFWPVNPTTLGYSLVFRSATVQNGFLNSLIYTSAGTAFSVFLTILAAYPLSRRDLYGRSFFMFLFTLTMFISGGLIPTYMVVNRLGMVDTRWALIIPGAVGVWNIIITRTFFQINIPEELLNAAQIDGCSDFRFVVRVVLPLSTPIIAVQILMFAVGQWNSYFHAIVYIHKPALQPLQVVLRNILILSSSMTWELNASTLTSALAGDDFALISYLLKYSLIVVASTPIMILYPFIQKYFIRGVLIGSLKG